MKKINIVITVVIVFFLALPAGTVLVSDSGHTLHSSFGAMSAGLSADWVTVSVSEEQTDMAVQSTDEIEVSNGFFYNVDQHATAMPQLLRWEHSPYFINVPNEGNILFEVSYFDQYSIMPSSGYPKVTYWKTGTDDSRTLSMDFTGNDGTHYRYSADVSLPAGIYYYRYLVENDYLPSEYSLEQSSFVVSQRPSLYCDDPAMSCPVMSNGRITFRWNGADPEGGVLRYKVYLGKTAGDMRIVYEGTHTACEINTLEYGNGYYYQVEAINSFGLTTKSNVFHFATLGRIAKAFNYPNPFNPNRQTSNIVFDMKENGDAGVSVYTEMGDLCWHSDYTSLPAGINEITYNGKDAADRILYNGTYVCIIRKNYASSSERDTCRLLVIK